ncbi:hypothetical protein AAFF39_04870 [Lactococcus garvieae]
MKGSVGYPGLGQLPAAAGDETSVNPSGNPQAFALSLADVVRLSTPEGLSLTMLRVSVHTTAGGGHVLLVLPVLLGMWVVTVLMVS